MEGVIDDLQAEPFAELARMSTLPSYLSGVGLASILLFDNFLFV
jgi:hypothetical protein